MAKQLSYNQKPNNCENDDKPIVHHTAIVSPNATIDKGVHIGPYCIIGDNVTLSNGVKLYSHIYIDGIVHIGANTTIFPFAVIGLPPQDLKYRGEASRVVIGENTIIREHVTIHTGTKLGRMETLIGNKCLLMVGSHIAHDCIVGNNVVMANNATLGGHVTVEDNVIIGGLAAIHQFVRIGQHSIVGGVSAVVDDVIPYASVAGDRAKLLGINTRGLRRHGFDSQDISALHRAYDILFKNPGGDFFVRVQNLAQEYHSNQRVLTIVKFLRENKVRPICTATSE